MQEATLLVEIGTEELPPKSLKTLSEAFAKGLSKQLTDASLAFTDVQSFATPRRLAVKITKVAAQQADKIVEKRGPSVDVAFDADGNPTKAAAGWARSNGISVEEADRLKTDKGEWLLYKAEVKGQAMADLLPDFVQRALEQLPVAKPMRWGNGDAYFIRPVHTVTLMYGDELVPGDVLGIASNNHLLGHRFHCPQGTQLSNADDYERTLEAAWVIADFDKRRALIESGIAEQAKQAGGRVTSDQELIDEVTALVEWPVALTASFDKQFLEVPKEPLIVTMKDDQRYFPLEDNDGNLLPQFVFITNIESKDPQQIILGNERVIRPRLADAQFFYEADKKTPLAARVDGLASVLFQKQLGSIKDKSDRIAQVARRIAELLGSNQDIAERAGSLCKADLVSQMVLEFPETQGVMGMYYARNDNEPSGVPEAIYEHYLPRYSGDALPQSIAGCAVALADKLDSLVGIFGIGQVPKGDRDPFALRRSAIGLLRIIVEKDLPLDLNVLVDISRESFGDVLTSETVTTDVVEFLLGRFRPWYQEQGVSVDVIQAVLARRPTAPVDFDKRVRAVTVFRELEEAQALAAANKRVANILAKLDAPITGKVDSGLLSANEEIALVKALEEAELSAKDALKSSNYTGALKALAGLQKPVDAFFDNVMVNADDAAVRTNRQAILQRLRELFLQIADISVLN
ncbi:Glycine--tRNA ligase beta subunit [Pseudidiomarina piscicola]|uniref:Glycine--tRNA ligase beta subunit n=1 Tax=Pseudidiomarina piscicola TaxID=2614830 RepID=A0A6S6WUJ3_9GAMM|nr:glycine--tRNA ligase subunit beta [Pseudidiomarina piscicola]CAB0150837.1 Glycine--tRNA ligase beta subunit [Pseudidiomarina piscicola]VZT40342.1 Glycine--tRNA ligase beta subunit [Pseudomonas aeruginosa]